MGRTLAKFSTGQRAQVTRLTLMWAGPAQGKTVKAGTSVEVVMAVYGNGKWSYQVSADGALAWVPEQELQAESEEVRA
ncbi:MAG: hypothetical protein M0Z43_00240 [Acidithiobacillus sp.]|nr:hypothetical protein [Acidithiobacillus sp.]